MSQRPKRDKANNNPRQIIIDNTQKRRTSAQVQEDARNAAAAKAAKQAADAQLKAEKIARIAAAEDNLRREDEVAKRNAEQPDLVVGKRASKKFIATKKVRTPSIVRYVHSPALGRERPPRMGLLIMETSEESLHSLTYCWWTTR